MSLRRVRRGEALAGAAALGLLAVLFLEWFALHDPGGGGLAANAPEGLARSGWSGVGWFMALLLGITIALGLFLAFTTAVDQPVAWSIGTAVLTSAVGVVTTLVLLIRLLTGPGLGAGVPDELVDIKPVAWLGLLLCALVALGGWLAMADERLDAPESAYTPPPARPVPGGPAT